MRENLSQSWIPGRAVAIRPENSIIQGHNLKRLDHHDYD